VVATNLCPTHQHFREVAIHKHKGLVEKMFTDDPAFSSSKSGGSVMRLAGQFQRHRR